MPVYVNVSCRVCNKEDKAYLVRDWHQNLTTTYPKDWVGDECGQCYRIKQAKFAEEDRLEDERTKCVECGTFSDLYDHMTDRSNIECDRCHQFYCIDCDKGNFLSLSCDDYLCKVCLDKEIK